MTTVHDRALNGARYSALLEGLGWPAITLADVVIEGPSQWAAAIRDSTALERFRLLRALDQVLLLATPAGRLRDDDWRARGAPRPLKGETRAWLEERLCLYGDLSGHTLVLDALSAVPDAVKFSVTYSAAFLVVRETRGWMQNAAFVAPDSHYFDRLVVLGPSADIDTAVHEIAHVWCATLRHDDDLDRLDCRDALTADGEHGLKTLARMDGWADRIDRWTFERELLADALAAIWLPLDQRRRASLLRADVDNLRRGVM